MSESAAEDAPRQSEPYALTPAVVRAVADALDGGDLARARTLTLDLHAADVADLLAIMRADERRALVRALGADLDPDILTEVDDGVREELLEQIDPLVLAKVVSELDTDDVVYVLEDLDEDRQREVLAAIPESDRVAVQRGLQYQDDTAGRMMQREFVAAPPHWTVGNAIDYMRERDDLPDEFYEIIVVDAALKPLGTIALSKIMASRRATAMTAIMDDDLTLIPVTMEQDEVAFLFEHYHLVSAPVVDESGRLVGVITIDDAVGVLKEEAEEDIMRLGGVGDEELSDPVLRIASRRFTWLLINLGTAILASMVIGLFEDEIGRMVALAVLMPIVASMGGNAGTQTLTVAVRALGTKELTAANAARIVWRETVVGGLNGLCFALIMAAIAGFWFNDFVLAGVIGAAMVINLLVAGLTGILVPLTLDRFGVDPAVASAVFVTTATDVVGFFAFLGLASAILL